MNNAYMMTWKTMSCVIHVASTIRRSFAPWSIGIAPAQSLHNSLRYTEYPRTICITYQTLSKPRIAKLLAEFISRLFSGKGGIVAYFCKRLNGKVSLNVDVIQRSICITATITWDLLATIKKKTGWNSRDLHKLVFPWVFSKILGVVARGPPRLV